VDELIIVRDWFTNHYIVVNEDGLVVEQFYTEGGAVSAYPEAEVLCVTFL
jgi:hypothetical protein